MRTKYSLFLPEFCREKRQQKWPFGVFRKMGDRSFYWDYFICCLSNREYFSHRNGHTIMVVSYSTQLSIIDRIFRCNMADIFYPKKFFSGYERDYVVALG